MATLYLKGKCRWAKLFKPDQKYNYYGIDVQLDDESLKAFRDSGITTVRETKGGEGYYSFKRRPDQVVWINGEQTKAGPPTVVDAAGRPTTDLVGNDSEVTIRVESFRYDNNYGKGVGCRLDGVMVNKLVPFEKTSGPPDAPKLKIMF